MKKRKLSNINTRNYGIIIFARDFRRLRERNKKWSLICKIFLVLIVFTHKFTYCTQKSDLQNQAIKTIKI